MVRYRYLVMTVLALAFCGPLAAGYEARDSWIPVVGHAVGYEGRGFFSTLHLTDTSHRPNDVSLSFYAAAKPNVPPRRIGLRVEPDQTAVVALGPNLTGEGGAIGALHIRASGTVVADARVYSRAANAARATEVGAATNAIPTRYAIGTGESTLLHLSTDARHKIYAVETHGFPIYFSVMATPTAAERRLYLAGHEQRSWDLDELFHGISVSSLRLTGINGSGKIIVLGSSISQQSLDFELWEMSLPLRARHRMRWPEATAYVAVALALVVAAVDRWRR